MTDIVLVALIAAFPSTLLAVVAIIKLFQVDTKMDGRLTQLLELTKKSSKAEGVKEEKDKQ